LSEHVLLLLGAVNQQPTVSACSLNTIGSYYDLTINRTGTVLVVQKIKARVITAVLLEMVFVVWGGKLAYNYIRFIF
jgi:hypothetical protein